MPYLPKLHTPIYHNSFNIQGAGGEGQRIRAAPGIRLAMSPSGPIFSPFRKGGYRGIWADKVCADRCLGWRIFPCRQHPATCNTANAEPLRVLCRNPPSPPFTKGGIIPVLADDLFDTAQQALPVFLPSPSWGEGQRIRAAPGIRLAMSPSGPIFSPFRKGGYRGIWADKVCADRYLDWCIF